MARKTNQIIRQKHATFPKVCQARETCNLFSFDFDWLKNVYVLATQRALIS